MSAYSRRKFLGFSRREPRFSIKNKKGWSATQSRRMRLIVMARDEVGGREYSESVS